MRIIGIDPGKHGSLALIEIVGSEFNVIDCQNMPEDEQLLVDLLIDWCSQELHELGPVLWMNAAIPANERSRDRTERKRQLLELTRQTWPNRKWTLQKADAPLIGKFGFLRSASKST